MSLLQIDFHNVLHALSLAEGLSDLDLVSLALEDQRDIITHDRDFSRIAYLADQRYGGMLVVPPDDPVSMHFVCSEVIKRFSSDLESGYVLITDGIRLRRILPYDSRNGT